MSTIHDLYCTNATNTKKTLSTTRWSGAVERARGLFHKRRDAFIAAKNTPEEKKKKEDRDHARTLFHRLFAFDRAEQNPLKASAQATQIMGDSSSAGSSEHRTGRNEDEAVSEISDEEGSDRTSSPPVEDKPHPRSLIHTYCQKKARRRSGAPCPE